MACIVVVLQACSSGDATAPAFPVPAVTPAVASAPRITRLGPDTLTAGGTLVIEGTHLPTTPGEIHVALGGVALPVRATSATRIEAAIPATAFPCGAVTPMPVRLQIGGARLDTIAPLATATRLVLAPGETARLLDAHAARCIEIAPPASSSAPRYVVAVVNTNPDPHAAAAGTLRGTATGALEGIASTSLSGFAAPAPSAQLAPDTRHPAHEGFHSTDLLPTLETRPVWPQATSLKSLRAPVSVGDTVSITAILRSCTTGTPLRARVVYAGARAVVLEDLKAPRAGRQDAAYAAIGREYDQVVHPLLTGQIGDPLAMNATMGGDGRVTMLFTPFVNDSAPGTAGYVSACNFYPRATFAASNQDEVLYARVPAAGETTDDWRRALRSTVVHEAKHLASFAERLAHGHDFEEPWLEEATARVAEELYSRTFSGGGTWRGRAGFAGSVACELLMCDDRPLIMWKHFAGLYGYLRAVDAMSPLAGAASSASYGAGWALVRWATDRYASNESVWLKALVSGSQGTGVGALARLAGRPEPELLADWSASLAFDHHVADASAEAALHEGVPQMPGAVPSWRVSEMMAGLAQLYPGAFDARPLKMPRRSFGHFVHTTAPLPGFASSYLTLDAAPGGSQLLALDAPDAASPLRAVIVRVR